MTSWSIAVPWKDNREQGLKGVIAVTESELSASPRVWHLVNTLNQKIQALAPYKAGYRQVKRLLLHGACLHGDTLLSDLLLTQAVNLPRLVAVMETHSTTRTPNQDVLCIKSAAGSIYTIPYQASTGIDEIKYHVAGMVRIPPHKQRLYCTSFLRFRGRVGYHNTLASWKISSGDTIYILEEQCGGGGEVFADVSDDAIVTEMELSDDALEWRICSEGLNIEGVCPSPDCEAYGRMVIHRNNFEAFNLKRDHLVRCPVCATRVKAITCGFYDCVWRFEGVRSHDRKLLAETSTIDLTRTRRSVQLNGTIS